LYDTTTFCISDPDIIEFHAHFLIPRSINTIRTVSFWWVVKGYPPPLPPKDISFKEKLNWIKRNETRCNRYWYRRWNAVWIGLGEMMGVRKLVVSLYFEQRHLNRWDNISPEIKEVLMAGPQSVEANLCLRVPDRLRRVFEGNQWVMKVGEMTPPWCV
jgi:hypothetical protein